MTGSPRRRRLAVGGITIQFLALVRTLSEVYRLRHVGRARGVEVTLATVEPYVAGGLIAAVCCWVAVTLFILGRYTAVIATAGLTVVLLLAYKFMVAG